MNSNIRFSLNFTTTKLLSYLIFLVGSIVAVIVESEQVFIQSIFVAAALQGVKSFGESIQKARSEPKPKT